MSLLILGSGGREAALAHKLREDGQRVFISPGNGGEEETLPDLSSDVPLLFSFCQSHSISFVIVGPEAPLCNGIVDSILSFPSSHPLQVFGPTQNAAQLEGSKVFSKQFMTRHNLPTADYGVFENEEEAEKFIDKQSWNGYVVKAEGLAAGKGVIVTSTKTEAKWAVKEILESSFCAIERRIIVEERLEGSEISALCFTDGECIRVMPLARDHKRLREGEEGPNTGGMGVVAPVEVEEDVLRNVEDILTRTVHGMKEDGIQFKGVLYAGLMLSPLGHLNILEYNVRFGDPETEVLLPLLRSPLPPILTSCVDGTLSTVEVEWSADSCCGVILAGGHYPYSSDRGTPIYNIPGPSKETVVFHCGTKKVEDKIVTNGGRILCVSSLGSTIDEARERAIRVADRIQFEGKHFRKDIGIRKPTQGVTYSSSGVDVQAGNDFVEGIKKIVKRTQRRGTDEIGGFGAVIDLSSAGFTNKPQLVVGMDGVGTKIEIADALSSFSHVGFDVVGMCVNDVVCHAAQPVAFLDYYVCGRLDKHKATQVVSSIAEACIDSGCSLVGGETAEMPGVYSFHQWDLAGCAIGVREADWPSLPDTRSMRVGDVVVGIASNGAHSNGFSLIRRIFQDSGIAYDQPTEWDDSKTYGDALLTPTRLYVQSVLPLMKEGLIKGAAHITGGGITENSIRCLDPKGSLSLSIDLSSWTLPPLFTFLANHGPVVTRELLRTFNCGVGMTLIVEATVADIIIDRLERSGEKAWRMGRVVERKGDGLIDYTSMDRFIPHLRLQNGMRQRRCRIAVLISGTGTNMKALINASHDSDSLAEIVLVISNRADATGIALARSLRVPSVVVVPHTKDRVTGDIEMHKILVSHNIQLICLAGFMRILSPQFVSLWKEKILNIHPSLLPSFKGAKPVEDALEAGAKITGCTVHFVESEVDSGRILAQSAIHIPDHSNAKELHRLIQEKEHVLFPDTMKKVARDLAISL